MAASRSRWADWGNARTDQQDMGKLRALLGPRLHPVRPARGKKHRPLPGQQSWHLPSPWGKP
jgi:hypothetical protein